MATEICEHAASPRTQRLPPDIVPGRDVVVRGERWRLTATLPHEDCVELRLHTAGGERAVLWPFDRVTPCVVPSGPRVVRPRRWTAWLGGRVCDALRGSLRVEYADGVDVLAYQLEPALAVASGRLRVLLADEVGLGKTIQAGWIAADAFGRNRNCRMLIAVPAGLREQWTGELRSRFGLTATMADARWLRRSAADLPPDVNPWSLPGVYVCSTDFLKRAEVLPALASVSWDLLIADEVHAAAAPTDRHAALNALGVRSRAVVLITATPYSGDAAAFGSIVRIGALADDRPPLMFRRSRLDVGDTRPRRHRFTPIRPTAAERRLHRLLTRYTREVWREAGPDAERARLAMIVLRKRALSSAAAALGSLERRLDLLGRRGRVEFQLPLFPEDEIQDDSEPDGVLGTPGLADEAREQRWLRALIAAARDVGSESKLTFLSRLLRRLDGEAAIIFTEYRDTLRRIAAEIGADLVLHGGLSAADRTAVVRTFNAHGGLLAATDAAAEGLNLQAHCRIVISYEVPWNPARLEQRIGRVDRLGQRRAVHAMTFVARDTAEDLILANVARRLTQVAGRFGVSDRLATFLTETRAAQAIIGGQTPMVEADGAAMPANAFERPDAALRTLASAEAPTLLARRRLTRPPFDSVGRDAQVISAMDGIRSTLPPGLVVLVEWSATTSAGETLRREVLAVHLPFTVRRPRRAAAARAIVAAALAQHERAIAAVVDDRAHVLAVETRRRQHDAIEARVARERALAPKVHVGAVQPGLFDRHVLAGADETARMTARIEEERTLRLDYLAASRSLHDSWRIAGVLIVGARR
ncbi:MAG: hypothetical protein DMF86_02315 [Acidobacteria bacterium]|nr:MAG: hypothetical protein DMF86_02315 [Acidobacteriota bacterium]